MISIRQFKEAQDRAAEMIAGAGVLLTDREKGRIEVADFGLSNLEVEGAQIATLFATDRVAAKVIAMFPRQSLPEHWHVPVGGDPGKEETVRVVWGTLYCYVPGTDTLRCGQVPAGKEAYYTSRHEQVLQPGDQATLPPQSKHWFQAGPEGVVFLSVSTTARDATDRFSDPEVVRGTKVY